MPIGIHTAQAHIGGGVWIEAYLEVTGRAIKRVPTYGAVYFCVFTTISYQEDPFTTLVPVNGLGRRRGEYGVDGCLI